jgi:hypothetical protein
MGHDVASSVIRAMPSLIFFCRIFSATAGFARDGVDGLGGHRYQIRCETSKIGRCVTAMSAGSLLTGPS